MYVTETGRTIGQCAFSDSFDKNTLFVNNLDSFMTFEIELCTFGLGHHVSIQKPRVVRTKVKILIVLAGFTRCVLKFHNECLFQSQTRNSVKIKFPQNWKIYDSCVHSLSHTHALGPCHKAVSGRIFTIGGSRGARPACAPPPRIQILSF